MLNICYRFVSLAQYVKISPHFNRVYALIVSVNISNPLIHSSVRGGEYCLHSECANLTFSGEDGSVSMKLDSLVAYKPQPTLSHNTLVCDLTRAMQRLPV